MVADHVGVELTLLEIIDAATVLSYVTLSKPLLILIVLCLGQYCDGFNPRAILSMNS